MIQKTQMAESLSVYFDTIHFDGELREIKG